jgi:hypothetical protein
MIQARRRCCHIEDREGDVRARPGSEMGRRTQWALGKVDVPGIGILSRTRHWLVLQGPDRYVILRLDGVDRADIMRAFEERVGIAIDRPSGVK